MKIKDFGVEQWMNKYETKARYNLGETCVAPFSLRGSWKLPVSTRKNLPLNC